jgi:ABC-2 type transport system permease protein
VILVGTNVALQDPAVWVVAIAAGLAFIALLAVSGQLFTSVVSSILRSRRSRDLAVFIVMALGLGSFAAYQVISRTIDGLGMQGALAMHSLDAWWFLPPVALQRSVTETAEGNLLAGLALLAVGVVWVVAIAWVWHRLLARMLVTPDSSPRPARERHARGFTAGLWGPRWVLARKELRFYVRDPRLRLVWTGTVIFVGLAIAGLVVGSEAFSGFREADWLPLLAPALVLFVGLPVALNQFGWERNAASYLFVLPASPRQLLVGKNLATVSGLLVETVFVSVLLAALSGSWSMLGMVPGLTLAAIGCQLAVGNLVSVVAPLRLPREGTDVFAQTTEQGCLALVAQMGGFFAIGMLMVIPASAVVLTVSFGQVLTPLFTTTLSALWGLAAYLASLSFSGYILRRRVPELVGWVQVI